MSSGGGGGGASSFKAQGSPPGFDYQAALGLQQLAVGGDITSYALSDADFANRYPALQDAYNQWQSSIGNQVGLVNQGAQAQGALMQNQANLIAGRQATPTTQNIQGIQAAANTAAGAVPSFFNLGGAQVGLGTSQAGLAQPIVGMGQQQVRIGQGINRLGGQLAGAAQIPYALGQQLLNEPIDPQTQQQMMLAGLGSAAGALGPASLGQGMAGQAAAARQLGLNTLQYGQAMRGEAMGDINQYASMLGAAGQMRGLGASTIGQGAQTTGLGGQQMAQAANTYGLGGQTYGMGVNAAAQAGGLYGQAQGAQEQYGMDTAQMAAMYGQMQQGQAGTMIGNIANANNIFQKRPFGLGGANLAQAELGQSGAYNSFQQANYATMNGIAFNQAQLAQQNAQMQQASNAGLMQAGVGVGTAAATTGATIAAMSCWVARECIPARWKEFRIWLLNFAPNWLRKLYLRHGESFAASLRDRPILKGLIRVLMIHILRHGKKRTSLLVLSRAGSVVFGGYYSALAEWPSGNFRVHSSHRCRSARCSERESVALPCPA